MISRRRTAAQLESAISVLKIQLDGEVLAELDRIWPGPSEAPQSYAW